MIFLNPLTFQSTSKKNREIESLADIVSKNDIPFNPRQPPGS